MNRFLSAMIIILFAVTASVIARQQPGKQRPSGQTTARKDAPGSITGRVLADGGNPVAGASVMAIPASLSLNPTVMSTFMRPASTDDDGKFQLNDIPQGAYTIHVMTPGFVIAQDAIENRYLRPGDSTTIQMIKGGVITGKVTGPQGEPVVGARVQATRIRDIENRPVKPGFSSLSFISLAIYDLDWKTDDRGIYRIYGLEPGVYRVAAGGSKALPSTPGAYDKDVPTYYPSSTADTASEVVLRPGEEATGIDIRYRAGAGRSVSGSVTGPPAFLQGGVTVMMTHSLGGSLAGATFVLPGTPSKGFAFDAVGEGDYFLTAYAGSASPPNEIATSQSRRVTVRGADVTGANLALSPLGVVTGHVIIESAQGADLKEKCKDQAQSRLDEIVVRARPVAGSKPEKDPVSLIDMLLSSVPGDKGEITLRHAGAGHHHIEMDLPAGIWYVRAITLPGATTSAPKLDAGRDGINLKAGGRLDGLVISLAEGAASIGGKVVSAKEGASLPSRLRVHLVPAEKEAAEDALRYAETIAKVDSSFEFRNLPPGRYWMVVRAIPDEESPENPPQPLAWDAGGRAGLRFEGEAINTVVELKACQRLADLTVRYSPAVTSPTKRRAP
jgi:hypothetical protein